MEEEYKDDHAVQNAEQQTLVEIAAAGVGDGAGNGRTDASAGVAKHGQERKHRGAAARDVVGADAHDAGPHKIAPEPFLSAMADDILTRFFGDFCDRADYWNEQIDWILVTAGVATFENYPRFGQHAWASFDGRVAHEAVSSNYSPAVGRDKEGITAVVLSSTKPDLTRLNNGCPVDLRVSFNKHTKEECSAIMEGFIKSFRDLGGNIMTITKVDIETLKKAQQEPEKYLSLRVRLGGLTVYFVQLAREQQDEYMRRTEHNM